MRSSARRAVVRPAGRGAASAPISSALRRSTTVRTPWASSARQPAAVRRSSASARTSAPRRTTYPSSVRRPPRSRTLKHPSQSSCRRTAGPVASAARVTGSSGAVARAEALVAAAVEQQRRALARVRVLAPPEEQRVVAAPVGAHDLRAESRERALDERRVVDEVEARLGPLGAGPPGEAVGQRALALAPDAHAVRAALV